MEKKVYFKTFGCQMNEADSQQMMALLSQDGYVATQNADEADLVVVNTCSVRDKAYHKAISEIGKHNKDGKKVQIGVTGCVASQEGGKLAKRFDGIDFVLGTDHIGQIREAVKYHRLEDGAYIAADFHEVEDYHFPVATTAPHERMVKAYVTIMKGCDNTCAFCIVPSTRGPEISKASTEIIKEIQLLEQKGVKEIMLLGQNVNSYGKRLDEGIHFPELLHMIHQRTSIPRIRFTSPHPKDLSPQLIEQYQHNPALCRHMHLPAQSGSSAVLKRMRRAHTRDTYLRRVYALREVCPEVAITTDLIVGFPGETDADFKETLSLMREVHYDASYSFTYSERPGTEAATFKDDIPDDVKKARLQELQALQAELSAEKNQQQVGRHEEILVEGESKSNAERMCGRTSQNRVVNFEGTADDIGKLITVEITRATSYSLYGEPIKS